MTHPLTRLLFDEMRARHVSVAVMAKRSGVTEPTIYWWRRGLKNPSIGNVEACLNVLGLQLYASRVPAE